MRWLTAALRRYADFAGRSRRREFWGFVLFLFLGSALAVWLDIALGTGGSRTTEILTAPGLWATSDAAQGGWITRAFGLAMLVPWLAVSVRRLHDAGWRGWWLLAGFVPLIGGVFLLVLMLGDGTRGPNRFGVDPKALPVME